MSYSRPASIMSVCLCRSAGDRIDFGDALFYPTPKEKEDDCELEEVGPDDRIHCKKLQN